VDDRTLIFDPLIMAYLVKGENCKSIFQLVKGKYIKPTHSQQTSIHTKAQPTAITELNVLN
jgi:hypothetical protein